MKNNRKLFHPTYCSLYVDMLFNETILANGTAFLIEYNNKIFVFTARHNLTGREHRPQRLYLLLDFLLVKARMVFLYGILGL